MAHQGKQTGGQQLAGPSLGPEPAQLFVGHGFDEQADDKEQAGDGQHRDGLIGRGPSGCIQQRAKGGRHGEHDDALKQEDLHETAPPPTVAPSFTHAHVTGVLATVARSKVEVDGEAEGPDRYGAVHDPTDGIGATKGHDAGRGDDDEAKAPEHVHDRDQAACDGTQPCQYGDGEHGRCFDEEGVHILPVHPPFITVTTQSIACANVDWSEKRAMQDSNPRLRLRRPEGYPDYPNRPVVTGNRHPS